jgi:hypothetical protein
MHTLQEYGTLRIEVVGMSHNCVEYRDSKDIGHARLEFPKRAKCTKKNSGGIASTSKRVQH